MLSLYRINVDVLYCEFWWYVMFGMKIGDGSLERRYFSTTVCFSENWEHKMF